VALVVRHGEDEESLEYKL